MKKFFKSAAEVASMTLVLIGLVICACETEAMDKQLMNAAVGFGMMFVGAVMAIAVHEGGEEDELS